MTVPLRQVPAPKLHEIISQTVLIPVHQLLQTFHFLRLLLLIISQKPRCPDQRLPGKSGHFHRRHPALFHRIARCIQKAHIQIGKFSHILLLLSVLFPGIRNRQTDQLHQNPRERKQHHSGSHIKSRMHRCDPRRIHRFIQEIKL